MLFGLFIKSQPQLAPCSFCEQFARIDEKKQQLVREARAGIITAWELDLGLQRLDKIDRMWTHFIEERAKQFESEIESSAPYVIDALTGRREWLEKP